MIRAAVSAGIVLLATVSARAQTGVASRTWVSGVGDDANPCSRTSPCKTFAGAISKTATGGEISVLDPGGFGAVTISHSVSIVADGVEGGVLVGPRTFDGEAVERDVVAGAGVDHNAGAAG